MLFAGDLGSVASLIVSICWSHETWGCCSIEYHWAWSLYNDHV